MEDDTSQNDSTVVVAEAAPVTTERPTALQAMESAARSAAEPALASGVKPTGTEQPIPGEDGKAPVAAIAQPAQSAKPATPADRGFISTADHMAAVTNARTKGKEEIEQQYAWAKGVDPAVAQRALALVQRLDTDPKAFATQLSAELAPSHEEEFQLPEADLRSRDGSVTGYSAKTLAEIVKGVISFTEKRAVGQMEGKLAPIFQEREEAQQTAAREKLTQKAIAEGRRAISDAIASARQDPTFVQHEAAISEKMKTFPREMVQSVGLVAAMHMAYSSVLADLMTTAGVKAEERVNGDLRRKAAAGAGNASPSGAVPRVGVTRPRNPTELAAHMSKLASGVGA